MRSSAESSVTTSIAGSVPASAAKDESRTQGPASAAVPIAEDGETRDLVRDELPGYTAGPLSAGPLLLSREYVPRDKSLHDRLTITVSRYGDAEGALREVHERLRTPGVTAVRRAPVAGLEGYSYADDGELVLTLAHGSLVLELAARPTFDRPDALRAVLVEIGETLLD